MGHGGDVIQELVTDHREVEEMFGRIEGLPSGHKERKEVADEVTIELVRHSVAEEMYLYPAVRRHVDDGDSIADHEIEEHSAAEKLMKQLEKRGADDPEFDGLIAELMREVRHHIDEEEQELFPRLRASASKEDLDKLGDQIRSAKKTAPTRPHPSAPSTPPANKLLAPGAGLVDRARDALSGRGKGS